MSYISLLTTKLWPVKSENRCRVANYDWRLDLPETMRKLCLSTKLPHQEIRWNYGIFAVSTIKCFRRIFIRNCWVSISQYICWKKWICFEIQWLHQHWSLDWTYSFFAFVKTLIIITYCCIRPILINLSFMVNRLHHNNLC